MDGDLKRKTVTSEEDRQKEDILGESEMEKELAELELLRFETLPERSPRVISPLNELDGADDMLAGPDVRRRIPTGKGREFEVQKLFKSALSNLTKQMNKMRPLLSSLKNVEKVRVESQVLDQLFARLLEVHERYINA